MKNRFAAPLAAVVVSFAFVSSALGEAVKYKVDPVHSHVVFKTSHLGVSQAWGTFNEPAGTVTWDEQDPANSRLEVTVQTAKVDTNNQKRDDHLRSPDFFNARQFPTITFKSTSVSKKSDNEYEVSGDLTLHGVTRPLTVVLRKVGEGDTPMGARAGWATQFDIKRSDFGMTNMVGPVGDDVTLFVAIEAVKQ